MLPKKAGGLDVFRMWFGCGSDVARTCFGSGADSLQKLRESGFQYLQLVSLDSRPRSHSPSWPVTTGMHRTELANKSCDQIGKNV